MYPEPEVFLARPTALQLNRRIAYIPDDDMGNAYTGRMRELLASFGEVERCAGIKSLLRQLPHSFRRYDVIVVNWMDNAIVAFGTGRISVRGITQLFFKTLLLKAFARRMVFVRHNNYPHYTAAGSESSAQRLVDFYENLFDAIVTHSGAAVASGRRERFYCPHPLYHAEAPSADISSALPGAVPAGEYFVAFGRIEPYKKIDALIENFPRNRILVVAGSVGDAAYAERLAGMKRDNVIFLPGRLSEAAAQQLVLASAGVVIANADPDVVVSGTFFYAMSLGRPIYAVTTSFLSWVQDRVGSELLVLGPDLKRLCRTLSSADPRRVSAASRAAVEHEFGDGAVRQALARALGIRP
jgi:glycosyltransferase involved in cell wall biosynthesis